MIVNQLFSIPVFVSKAKKHQEVSDYLMNDIYPAYQQTGYNSNSCAVFSDYFEGSPKSDQALLNSLYRENIEELLVFTGFNPEHKWQVHTLFWYNITGKGGWQEMHDHISGPLPSQFSAVHYVKFDKEHQPLEFENPMATLLKSMSPSDNYEIVPPFFKERHATPNFVEEGDILFFPSYLKHAVNIQQSEKERITVAFNIGVWNHRMLNNA